MFPVSCYLQSQQRSVDLRVGSELLALFAELSCPSMEIRMPHIERFLLGSEVPLKLGLTFGNDAPTTRIFVKKDSRYLYTLTIAESDFACGHRQ
jgi:hypothetical protein